MKQHQQHYPLKKINNFTLLYSVMPSNSVCKFKAKAMVVTRRFVDFDERVKTGESQTFIFQLYQLIFIIFMF